MQKLPIFWLRFRTKYELAATLMRFQEYYESPKFRGKFFSREEFTDWYARRYGEFTYFEDWVGFNLPSSVFQPFYQGHFDPLDQKEKRLLDIFRKVKGRFYVVSTICGDIATLRHEVAHALFFLDIEYQKRARACITKYNTREARRRLRKRGYSQAMLIDEINAYVLADIWRLGRFRSKGLANLRKELRKIFEDWFGFSITRLGSASLVKWLRVINF